MISPDPDPSALSLLLSKTAPEWSDEEVQQFIIYLRSERRKYLEAEEAGRRPKRTTISEASRNSIVDGIKSGSIEIEF